MTLSMGLIWNAILLDRYSPLEAQWLTWWMLPNVQRWFLPATVGMLRFARWAFARFFLYVSSPLGPEPLLYVLLISLEIYKTLFGYLKELIAQGANIDLQNKGGWTPLIRASYYNYPRVVKSLINWGELAYSLEVILYIFLLLCDCRLKLS